MPASVTVFDLASQGLGSTATLTSSPGVTPTGSNRAVVVFNAASGGAIDAATANAADEVRYTNSSGTLVNGAVGTATVLDVFSFTYSHVRNFAAAAPPAALTPLYNHWPANSTVRAMAAVYLQDADQTTPVGSELISSEIFWDTDPHACDHTRTGLSANQKYVGAMMVFGLGNIGATYAEGADTNHTILGVTTQVAAPGGDDDGRYVQIVLFHGTADSSGNAIMDIDANWGSDGSLINVLFMSRPVNDAAGGDPGADLIAENRTTTLASAALVVRAALVASDTTATLASAALITRAALVADGRTSTQASAVMGSYAALVASDRTPTAASAALTTRAALVADGRATTQASASLTTRVALSGQATTTTAASGVLSSSSAYVASGATSTSAAASLTTRAALVAADATPTQASAALTVQVQMVATNRTPTSAAAIMGSFANLAASAITQAQASAALTTRVALSAVGQASTSAQASLMLSRATIAGTAVTLTRAFAFMEQAGYEHPRSWEVPADDRTYTVGADSRTFMYAADDRTAIY